MFDKQRKIKMVVSKVPFFLLSDDEYRLADWERECVCVSLRFPGIREYHSTYTA